MFFLWDVLEIIYRMGECDYSTKSKASDETLSLNRIVVIKVYGTTSDIMRIITVMDVERRCVFGGVKRRFV